jgi:hypothetical protein
MLCKLLQILSFFTRCCRMLSAKLPATPDSKFKLSKAVRIVELVVADEEPETFDILETSSVGPVVTRRVGYWVVASVGLLVPGVDIVLVFRILRSWILRSCNNFRLAGQYHPRSLIAFLLVDCLVNGFSHKRLIMGIASLFAMTLSTPIQVLYMTSFPFSLVISAFHHPLCSEESPTCHFPVPCRRSMQFFTCGLCHSLT